MLFPLSLDILAISDHYDDSCEVAVELVWCQLSFHTRRVALARLLSLSLLE